MRFLKYCIKLLEGTATCTPRHILNTLTNVNNVLNNFYQNPSKTKGIVIMSEVSKLFNMKPEAKDEFFIWILKCITRYFVLQGNHY